RRGRQRVDHPAKSVGQQGAVRAKRPPAEPVPVEADSRQLRRAFAAQLLNPSALDDGEEPRRVLPPADGAGPPVELIARTPSPGDGSLHAARLLVVGRLRIGAVVEADHDVRSKLELDLDDSLRGEGPLLAGRGLAEDDLVVADHSARGILADQRPDLEATGVT